MGKLEKISAWNLTKVRSKKQAIDEARAKGAKVHFASLMDICHLKNAELEAKHQKYKGRVALRGDIVKHDSGSIMDIISRLPGCDFLLKGICMVILWQDYYGKGNLRRSY